MLDADPVKSRPPDADGVSDGLLPGQNKIETSFGCIDDDSSGLLRPGEVDGFARGRIGDRPFVALERLLGWRPPARPAASATEVATSPASMKVASGEMWRISILVARMAALCISCRREEAETRGRERRSSGLATIV
jgi:hypothetical protein